MRLIVALGLAVRIGPARGLLRNETSPVYASDVFLGEYKAAFECQCLAQPFLSGIQRILLHVRLVRRVLQRANSIGNGIIMVVNAKYTFPNVATLKLGISTPVGVYVSPERSRCPRIRSPRSHT